jgi:acyl dehydratase
MVHTVDERWTMAYAAAIGRADDVYFDTTAGSVVAHPLFVVCPEWPVIVGARQAMEDAGVTADEVRTSVHATHDVTIHRLIRPGDELTTTLQTVGIEQIRPGAMSTTRLQTVDRDGAPVATTTQTGIHLGVTTDGPDRPDPDPPDTLAGDDRSGRPIEVAVPLEAGAAHVYTECARIWNPIHTDKQVALSAGLPDIILHGTANLAHGVSAVVEHRADGRPDLVRRVRCRFRAMVQLPSTITVRVWPAASGTDSAGAPTRTVPFEVLNAQGDPAVADGQLVLGAG